MPTGACGVNCDVCQLRLLEICSTCGAGKSPEAERKLEAQKRLLGSPCPILACAHLKRIDYCLRDCGRFPCENFSEGPYPFSQGFLSMQKRRRDIGPAALTHNRSALTVPQEYWDALGAKEPQTVSWATGAALLPTGEFSLRFLNETLRINPGERTIERLLGDRTAIAVDAMVELVVLLYLTRLETVIAPAGEKVAPEGLKEAHYFRGPHALDLGMLVERYGRDAEGFCRSAASLGGTQLTMASDAAVELMPLPRVPVYYLLWVGDDEFPPKISVLFDKTIEQVFSASAIWALVKVVSRALLSGARGEQS